MGVVANSSGIMHRTFAEVKTMPGEWKADPRFKESWFFVREVEDEGGKK